MIQYMYTANMYTHTHTHTHTHMITCMRVHTLTHSHTLTLSHMHAQTELHTQLTSLLALIFLLRASCIVFILLSSSSSALIWCLLRALSFCTPAVNGNQEKKRKEKTTPFGINLMRSQVLYRATQNGNQRRSHRMCMDQVWALVRCTCNIAAC